MIFRSNDATDMLIDLYSEETIQFALESSKTSNETREVYSTLQVSNTFYLNVLFSFWTAGESAPEIICEPLSYKRRDSQI